MGSEYEGKEKGQSTSAHIEGEEISLFILPDVGSPTTSWIKDGWELTPLKTLRVS